MSTALPLVGVTAIAGQPSQPPLGEGANRKSSDDVARPMCKQHDPGCDQTGPDQPHGIPFVPGQLRSGRRKRPDMHGMS